MTVHHGDCLEVMAGMPADSIDAIVTDPPYGLGFMGRAWDALPPGQEWAEACLRILKPGGHIVAFGGTRTWHRLAVAIEDAGFEMRDSLAWLYGSGFPKSHDVSKAIDKIAGAEREVTRYACVGIASGANNAVGGRKYVVGIGDIPATPEAAEWDGWGTALKPAFEPIVLARKPFPGTVAANVLEHGTGAINVDACRVESDGSHKRSFQPTNNGRNVYGAQSGFEPTNASGRWPANVLLDQHAAAWVDEQSGYTKSPTSTGRGAGGQHGITNPRGAQGRVWAPGDEGGASRFFYTAKAPKRERPNVDGVQHPTVKPLALMEWLIRLITPPGGTVLDPFAGSGTTLEAAKRLGVRAIGIEREAEYLPLIQHRLDRVVPDLLTT